MKQKGRGESNEKKNNAFKMDRTISADGVSSSNDVMRMQDALYSQYDTPMVSRR